MNLAICLRAALSQVEMMISWPFSGYAGVYSEVRGPMLMSSDKGDDIISECLRIQKVGRIGKQER